MDLKKQLVLHEGLSFKPYRCPAGKLTIGVGRNLTDVGISEEEALILLENDIARIKRSFAGIDWFEDLSENRKNVILDMAFNLGIFGFFRFEKMITALRLKLYDRAADEMKNSKWYKQVGNRGKALERMMRFDIPREEVNV